MFEKDNLKKYDTSIFLEELQKRVPMPEEEFEKFIELWEFKTFKRNEFVQIAGEIPPFSIFVLRGCLRQYTVNVKGEESIVYFAEERHFIGDLPALRNRVPSDFNFQATEACELLTISTEHWEKSFIDFPWWAHAHMSGYQKWASSMQQQMSDRHLKSGEERYLALLQKRPALFQRVPQHFIASYLGLNPETLSRIRKKLAGK